MTVSFGSTIDFARQEDEKDALRSFRDEFWIPVSPSDESVIYLTGNSLGLQPKSTAAYLNEVLNDWKHLGVEAHFAAENAWMPYHELLSPSMASLVGAEVSEVVVMNSLSVNLHLLMASFYRPSSDRYGILIEADAFPSDQYAVSSQISWHGFDPATGVHSLAPREGASCLDTEDILAYLDSHGHEIALVLLGGVNYYTGQFFDINAIRTAAHRNGCVFGLDLAHAAGNVALSLHDWDVDFAAWCSYKYLNAGPGGPGSVFVHDRHARSFDIPRLAGWWGHDKSSRFRMPNQFRPITGAEGWQLSNPSILAMAALRASLDVFDRAPEESRVSKSRRLTGFLEHLLQLLCPDVHVITPSDPAQRGAQLSLRVPSGRNVFEVLHAHHVITDWREPDVIRVAPVPLYNTFEDIYSFVTILSNALKT
jgi:kynureninase